MPFICASMDVKLNRLPSGTPSSYATPRLRTMLSTAAVLVFTSLVWSASSLKKLAPATQSSRALLPANLNSW